MAPGHLREDALRALARGDSLGAAKRTKEKPRLAAGLSCSRLGPGMTLAISFRFLALTVWILLLLARLRTAALLLAGLLPRVLILLARLVLLTRLVLVGHLCDLRC